MRGLKLFFILILFLVFNQLNAQEFVFEGVISDLDAGNLSGVTISAKSNGTEISKVTSDGQGKYRISLPINKSYKVFFSKPGYVSKMMTIDANGINEEDLPIGGEIMPPVNLDLFTERPGADFSFMKSMPIVDWVYLPKKFKMAWDENQYFEAKERIEEALAKAEKVTKENEAKYNRLITDADQLFLDTDYQGALDKYEEALSIPGKQMEQHPNNRILEIEELLQAQRKEELLTQQADQKYLNLIEAAEALRANEEYDKAITKFYEALDEKPDEQYPLDQIDELQELLKEKKRRAEYESLIEMADRFYDQNSMQAARDKYERALRLYENEEHPRKRLEEMENALKAEQELQERKKKYNDAIQAADKFYNEENYELAIEKYKEAMKYESASTYPQQRIDLAQEFIDKAKEKEQQQAAYDSLIVQGDDAMSKEDYEQAIAAYTNALNIYENEEYPKSQKLIAEQKREEQLQKSAQQEKIAELLTNAKKALEEKDWEGAIELYTSVIELDEVNQEAITGKKTAEDEKQKEQQEKELQNQFDALVSEAFELFENEKWEEAKEKYTAADQLISGNENVKSQIQIIETKIAEQKEQNELESQIEALLEEAKNFESSEDWSSAKNKYQEVLDLQEDNEIAKSGKLNAEAKIAENAELAELETKWNQLLSEAEELFTQKNYEEAKVKYEEAKALKETEEITKRLKEIEEKLALIAEESAQKEKWESLIAEADQLFDEEKWEEAKVKYSEAESIEISDHITAQKTRIEEKLNALASEAEQEQKRTELLTQAEELYAKGELNQALINFEEANQIKQSDEITQKIESIKSEINEQKLLSEQQEKINQLVAEGDQFMLDQNYAAALDKFKEALLIKDDTDIQTKKLEAESALAELSQNDQIDQAFDESMNKGNEALKNGNWDEAILAFEDAQSLKPNDGTVSVKIEEAKAGKSNSIQFEQLVLEGNQLKDQGKLNEAIEKYTSALTYVQDDAILAEIEALKTKLAQQESANEEEAFDKLVEEAASFEEENNLESAIDRLEKALLIKEDNAVAEKKEALIAELERKKAEEEQSSKIQNLMEKGLTALTNKDYSSAIDAFQEVLNIDDKNEEAAIKLEAAKEGLKKLEEEEERYQSILAEAELLFQEENWEESKKKYEEAKDMRKSDPVPQSKIVEIDEIIRKEQAQLLAEQQEAKNQAAYDQLMEKAAKAENDEKLEEAITFYSEASELKPSEVLPKDKIELIKKQLAQIKAMEDAQEAYELAIKEGDLALKEQDYKKSIESFTKALEAKENDDYAKKQLQKAKDELAIKNKSLVEEQFRQEMLKVEQALANENYQAAMTSIDNALELKPEDEVANEKKLAVQQIIDQLAAQEAKKAEKQAAFDALIKLAESAFNRENYIEAYNQYEKALKIIPNDPEAKLKKEESKRLAQDKLREQEDKEFEALLNEAAQLFADEKLEEALVLYEKASTERPSDTRASIKVAEIKRLMNQSAKAEAGLEYLGEEEDISIVEGALLLEKAEQTRKALKKQKVVNKIVLNEQKVRESIKSDQVERQNLEFEADRIRDLRNDGYYENNRKAQDLSVEVDQELFSITEKIIQENKYERGDVYRENDKITYVNDAYRGINVEKKDHQYQNGSILDNEQQLIDQNEYENIQRANKKYLNNDEQISLIVDNQVKDVERSNQMRRENADIVRELGNDKTQIQAEENRVNNEKWLGNSEQIDKIEDLGREDFTRSNEMRRENADFVQLIEERQIDQHEENQTDNYNKIQFIQQKATEAEIKEDQLRDEKLIIQNILEEDIQRINERNQDQLAEERRLVYNEQLKMDAYLVEQQETYLSTLVESDNRRKQTVETVKEIQSESDKVYEEADKRKQRNIYDNMDRVERIAILQEQGLEKLDKDMRATQELIQLADENVERTVLERQNEKERQQRGIEYDIEKTQVANQNTITEKNEIARNNGEQVDGEVYLISAQNQRLQEEKNNKSREIQSILDQLELNKIKYTEIVANTLGDEFPAGVSQEVYVRRDKDNLPIEIITRRIVVKEGRGDVYLRVQKRNIITYSKNGMQITETGWINGTESAKLVRHF